MATKANKEISIRAIEMETMSFYILGTTPLIVNRKPFELECYLTLPPVKKNKAELAMTTKHDPIQEYRDACYTSKVDTFPTLLTIPSGAFKGALADVARDIPGAFRTQVARLTSIVNGPSLPLWGIPLLRRDAVVTAGIKASPDIRFRPCLVEWATKVVVRFVKGLLKPADIANLLGAAGRIVAVGDNRVQKGKGDYGQWDVVGEDNEDWLRIVETQGRGPQTEALTSDPPPYYDEDAERLVTWYKTEIARRAAEPAPAPKAARKRKGEDMPVVAGNGADADGAAAH